MKIPACLLGRRGKAGQQSSSFLLAARSSKFEAIAHAFTLTELLVILGLILLGMSIIVPGLAHTRPNSQFAHCRNNLRQIGYACAMYAQENRDSLPGPCWAGLFSTYCWYPVSSTNEPTGPNRYFGSHIAYTATYLGMPPPTSVVQTAQVAICPAYWRAVPPGAAYSPPVSGPAPYYNRQFLRSNPDNDASSVVLYFPFGRPNTVFPPSEAGPDGSAPAKKINQILRCSEQWAIADDDREINSGGTYHSWLPVYATHGRSGNKPLRNFLFFDWHVEPRAIITTQNP